MTDEQLLQSLERALARLVGQFEQSPDRFMRTEDLLCGLMQASQEEPELVELYRTQDGCRTTLLHRQVDPFGGEEATTLREATNLLAARTGTDRYEFPDGFTLDDLIGVPPYEIGLFNPSFVQSQPFDVVANRHGQGERARDYLREHHNTKPLLAVVKLALVDDLGQDTVRALERLFFYLLCSQSDAQQSYMAIFCREWDLDAHIRRALPLFQSWSELYPRLSLVLVQSYYDELGRVFGGKYLNVWRIMAPLSPL